MEQLENNEFTKSVEEFDKDELDNKPILNKFLKRGIDNPILIMGEIFLFFNTILYLLMSLDITNNFLIINLVFLVPYIITSFLFIILIKKTTVTFFTSIYFMIIFSVLIFTPLFLINIFIQNNNMEGAGFVYIYFIFFSFGLTILLLITGIFQSISVKYNPNTTKRIKIIPDVFLRASKITQLYIYINILVFLLYLLMLTGGFFNSYSYAWFFELAFDYLYFIVIAFLVYILIKIIFRNH